MTLQLTPSGAVNMRFCSTNITVERELVRKSAVLENVLQAAGDERRSIEAPSGLMQLWLAHASTHTTGPCNTSRYLCECVDAVQVRGLAQPDRQRESCANAAHLVAAHLVAWGTAAVPVGPWPRLSYMIVCASLSPSLMHSGSEDRAADTRRGDLKEIRTYDVHARHMRAAMHTPLLCRC